MGALSKIVGKALSTSAKKESSEVAKRSTELMGRKPEKFMGMVDEVTPKRLSGPAASEKSNAGKAAAAGLATAAGIAALADRDAKEKPSTRVESRGRSYQEERPTRDENREIKKPSTFGAAFKEARAAGKDVFVFEGKKYTTELASEKKAASKKEVETEQGVREGRNENIDDDTRKRAMESVANLAKGGMVFNKGVGASMKPHNVFGKKK